MVLGNNASELAGAYLGECSVCPITEASPARAARVKSQGDGSRMCREPWSRRIPTAMRTVAQNTPAQRPGDEPRARSARRSPSAR